MVYEIENFKPGTFSSSLWTSVDLPEPDGAEMINTVFSASLQVQGLLADLVNFSLCGQRQFRNRQTQIA